jgi:peptidyl-prolyl cis-trans isomerase B (cyclophilin B)
MLPTFAHLSARFATSARLLAALPLLWVLAGCTSGESNATPSTSAASTEQTSRAQTMIRMHTNHGVITLQLDTENAPKTTANFLQYADDGHFNGTIFHRVIPGFMIQGGGFEPGMQEKNTREPVENEAKNGLKNKTGTIAMARTMDPHSATAQFFINVNNNSFLDYPGQDGWGYCVFGEVTEGLDIVMDIAKVKTGRSGFHDDVPVDDVVIEKIERVEG